ncbi:MAG: DUF4852 domain-containing protein [Verrucomicrobia bacterium]|nr:DUF4852 domain-containing protein [Verrucomicrobiota bacterium]
MKVYSLPFIILATIACANAQAVRLSDDNAPFVYEVKAEIPTPKETLAKILSNDYRNAPDEFTAHELFEKIEPVIDKRVAEAKTTKTWMIVIGAQLAAYDFKAKGFPSGFSESTFIPFNRGYAVMFSNASDFSLVPVDMATAKGLSSSLQRNREVSITVEGALISSKEKELNYSTNKVVFIEINKVTMKLRDGTVVGEKTK